MIPILAKFGKVYGIDSSPKAIEICQQNAFSDVYLDNDPQWQDRRFDVLTFFEVIEHVERDLDFLNHYLQWLKPGGLIFITVPAFMFLWSEHDEINQHERRYTRIRCTA